MRRRSAKNQWLVISILISLTFCGSFFFGRNQIKVFYDPISTTPQTTAEAIIGPSKSTTEAYHKSLKHVTKSLSELGKMDEINSHVLFLNLIPNCGAEVLVFLMQKMQGFNNYRHVRLGSEDSNEMSRSKEVPQNLNLFVVEEEDIFYKFGREIHSGKEFIVALCVDQEARLVKEAELVHTVYETIRDAAVPLSFDKQIRFINFTSFDKQSPTFVNLIREPADKLLSRSRFGQHKKGNNDDNIDEDGIFNCPSVDPSGGGESDCYVNKIKDHYDLSVAYFCGHDPRCEVLNSQWALQAARTNVEKYYPVVGTLEELNATLEVLEDKIPYFFKGVQDMYRTHIADKFTNKKTPRMRHRTKTILKRVLATEYEFYDWIRTRLFRQLQIIYGGHSGGESH